MVQLFNDKLVIVIEETSPEERLQWLLKAIAAAMRWEAQCPEGDKYVKDGENKYVLAQLLEELVQRDKVNIST